jgi:hypothetical protein
MKFDACAYIGIFYNSNMSVTLILEEIILKRSKIIAG